MGFWSAAATRAATPAAPAVVAAQAAAHSGPWGATRKDAAQGRTLDALNAVAATGVEATHLQRLW